MASTCCVKRPIPVQLEVLILGPDNFQSIDALAVILGSLNELWIIILKNPLPGIARLAETLWPETAAIKFDIG